MLLTSCTPTQSLVHQPSVTQVGTAPQLPAGVCGVSLPLSKLLWPACMQMAWTEMLPCLQEFQDWAASSAGLPPAQLQPQSTGSEEYDPAAFGQDVPPGSGYQQQPAPAEAVPAWTVDDDEDPMVEQQRRLLEQYQKLAVERRQV